MSARASVEVPNPYDDGAPVPAERAEFLDYLCLGRNLSPNTALAYARDLCAWATWAAEQGVDPLRATRRDVRRYLAGLADADLAPATVNRRVSSLRAFYAWLVREGRVAENPVDAVSAPKLVRRLPTTIDAQDMARLLAVSDTSTPVGARDQAMLETMYASGCRVGELAALDVGDVDLDQGQVRLFGKGSKERVVPLYGRAVKALRSYLADARPVLAARRADAADDGRASAQALMLSVHGRRMTADDLRKRFERLCRAAGLPAGVSPHAMRHTFATDVLAGGADLRSVQEMLGHASLATTQIYTHLTPERLRQAARQAHPRGE